MTQVLDSDRAVGTKEADEFGFVGIAESLAPRTVSYTHLPSPRDATLSRMPSSA